MNHRPSHHGCDPEPLPDGRKDRYRGVDPDRVDVFAAQLDGAMAEMAALGKSGKPIRARNAKRLLDLARLVGSFADHFAAEVELAL